MRQPGEPSVEEILESIKKVIARDNRAGSAQERRLRETRGLADDRADQAVDDRDDVLDLAVSAQFLDESGERDEELGRPDTPGDPVGPSGAAEPPLTGDAARADVRESLAALAMMAQPRAAPQIVRSGETSLEDLARDLLRPALAQWLDSHLPPMVERLVAAEIARIVGKRV